MVRSRSLKKKSPRKKMTFLKRVIKKINEIKNIGNIRGYQMSGDGKFEWTSEMYDMFLYDNLLKNRSTKDIQDDLKFILRGKKFTKVSDAIEFVIRDVIEGYLQKQEEMNL